MGGITFKGIVYVTGLALAAIIGSTLVIIALSLAVILTQMIV